MPLMMEEAMRHARAAFVAAMLAAGGMGNPAWADRGHFPGAGHYEHHHRHYGGLGLGAGLVLGSAILWAATRPPPAPVYVAPEPVVVMPPRVVAVPAPPSAEWWYYCRPAGAYYPYVQTCPTGWERVAPRPDGGW